jgi:hypothetical protein
MTRIILFMTQNLSPRFQDSKKTQKTLQKLISNNFFIWSILCFLTEMMCVRFLIWEKIKVNYFQIFFEPCSSYFRPRSQIRYYFSCIRPSSTQKIDCKQTKVYYCRLTCSRISDVLAKIIYLFKILDIG